MAKKKKMVKEAEEKASEVAAEATRESMFEMKMRIKEAEAKKREEKLKELPKDTKMDFDSWYHSRASQIPKCHMKEILWADFKARKLSKVETSEKYDAALEKYGVKLSS